ncbi:MAG: stage 0 sporulation family protein [Lachnospiraceae bacterium]|nr:stage 0 sporulation family protein [Lachnospiraceae bacterium]
MTKIVGVRFRNAGKSYYFDPKDMELFVNDKVIVETARGIELGTVTIPAMEVEDDKVSLPLKEVTRKATEEDKKKAEDNISAEKEAYKICMEKIAKHNLEMKLVQAEYTFDKSKLLFYFTADGRVDFRELVKDLASVFHTRIELRQIGVRDETKILGGIGICGRELCCKTYLTEFAPVSIKMAKEQNLSLNPTKISGVCGRLMCCLKNEEDTYEYLNKTTPKRGDIVATAGGETGEIIDVNVLRQTLRVLFEENDNKEVREYAVEEVTVKGHKKKGQNNQNQKEAQKLSKEEQEASKLEELDKIDENNSDNNKKNNQKNGKGDKKDNNKKKNFNKKNHHNKKNNKPKDNNKES